MILNQWPQKFVFAPLLALTVLFYGCGGSKTADEATVDAVTETAESPAEKTDTETTMADAETATEGEVDLVALFGTDKAEWIPQFLADKNLKGGMTPEEVGQVIPGAEDVSEFGFSDVDVKDIPGVTRYTLYYAKDDGGQPTQLQSFKITFDPNLKNDEFYQQLVDALAAKYGDYKPEDFEKKMITWVNSDFNSAQLTEGLSNDEGYQFDFRVPE
jgi:hypothetical protein